MKNKGFLKPSNNILRGYVYGEVDVKPKLTSFKNLENALSDFLYKRMVCHFWTDLLIG